MREIDEAIIAVKEERIYQEGKWTDDDRSIAKFLILISNYIQEAMWCQGRVDSLTESHEVLDDLRKIAALAICAMEYNGVSYRRDGGHDAKQVEDSTGSPGANDST